MGEDETCQGKARRGAFADESFEQAKEQGKRLAVQQANRPSFSERVAAASKSTAKFLVTPQKQNPKRQRAPVRKAAKKKTSRARPVKKNQIKKSLRGFGASDVFDGLESVF